jgi:acyl-CoA reductase-like NAD-dependent aldehyde dehydrogenase
VSQTARYLPAFLGDEPHPASERISTAAEVDVAVAAAAAAFTTWRRVDAGERAGHLRALADAMEGAAGELVGLHQRDRRGAWSTGPTT